MIIKITDEIDLASDFEAKLTAIENLLKAHGEGKHHLWMPVPTLKELLKVDGFGVFSKKVLYEMMSQSNEQRMIHKDFFFYVSVDFVDKHRLDFVDGVLHSGYQHFYDSGSTQESILLTENDLDGEAYIWGAKTYLHKQKVSGLNVVLDIQPGGGNTTISKFKRLDKGKRFFACFIDSDKDHPEAAFGGTAKRFRSVVQGFEGKRYFEVLRYHEIENVLPFSILRAVSGNICDDGIAFKPQYISYRAFPDHKTGFSVKQALSDDRNRKSTYWAAIASFDEEEMICPRFGEDLLKNCVAFMSSLSPKKSVSYIDEKFDDEWLRISKLVASWGVGGRALRS